MHADNGNITGMILSGGGAYAAYEVGVMGALFGGQSPATHYVPLSPQVMAGTSAGAFNAALFAAMPELDPAVAAERLADVWLDQIADWGDNCGNGLFRFRANPFNAFGIGCPRTTPAAQVGQLEGDATFLTQNFVGRAMRFFSADASLQQRTLELIDVSAVVSTDPFAEVVRRNIRLDRIRSSAVQLRIAATNWRTGELRTFRGDEMTDEWGHDIVRASAAVPGIFDSVEVAGEPYVDGGLVMNSPLREAIGAGANELHIIYINPDVVRIPLPRVRNTVNTMFRALVVNLAATASRDIEAARQVNLGLHLLQHTEMLATASHMKAMIQQVSAMARHLNDNSSPYRMLTIHRYSPREMVGGLYRWLSFERDHLTQLIQRGYADAMSHDCKASGCVMPDEVPHA